MRVEEFKQYQKSGLKEFQKKVSDSSQHQFAKRAEQRLRKADIIARNGRLSKHYRQQSCIPIFQI